MNHKDTKSTKGFIDNTFFVFFVSSWFNLLRSGGFSFCAFLCLFVAIF